MEPYWIYKLISGVRVKGKTDDPLRAVFCMNGEFKTMPYDGKWYLQLMRDYPHRLVGVYTRDVKEAYILADAKDFLRNQR